MNKKHFPRPCAVALACALCVVALGKAQAVPIDLGDPDLRLSWDNTLGVTLGQRLAARNDAIANNPGNDEGNYKFDRGDLITSRIDLLSELDLAYQRRSGMRLSVAAWADPAYDDEVRRNPRLQAAGFPSSYQNDRYSSATKRQYVGPSAELRDAFVYGSFDVAGTPANVRLGRHTVYWGEAIFTQGHGIAYSQGPVDTRKAATTPGAQAKDLFLPLTQLSLQSQLSEQVSLAAQYFLEWKPSRLSEGGTYFGFFDAGFAGPDRLAANSPANTINGIPVSAATAAAIAAGSGGALSAAAVQNFTTISAAAPAISSLTRTAELKPGSSGNWGVNLRFEPTGFDGTLGVYYRRFDEKFPWKPQIFNGTNVPLTVVGNGPLTGVTIPLPPGSQFAPSSYRFVYAQGVDLLGVSASTKIGTVSVAGELSWRHNTALQGFVQAASPTVPGDNEGPRGDVLNLVVNGVAGLTQGPLWDTGLFLIEGVYSQVQKVRKHAELYEGEGYAACAGDRRDGCATKNMLGMALSFTPQWLSVATSVNLSMPLSVTYGIKGNSATAAGFNERGVNYSIGLEADLYQRGTVRLSYNNQHYTTRPAVNGVVQSGNGFWQLNDRGWVSLTGRMSF